MEDILAIKTKKCSICKKDLPLSEYKLKYSYSGRACYKCLKEKSNFNNREIKRKIKEASGDCWWIEQWCHASLYYYTKKKNR